MDLRKKIKKNYYSPFLVETDFNAEFDDFSSEYSEEGWVDSNVLYKDYVHKATSGKRMEKFYVKEIRKMSRPTLRLVSYIFKEFNIRPKEFRIDFFKVLPGGSLPYHVDQKSKISFCLPIKKNTGFTYFKRGDVEMKLCYQNMIVLNNLELHGVGSPTEERLLFRIGVHDVSFEEMLKLNV